METENNENFEETILEIVEENKKQISDLRKQIELLNIKTKNQENVLNSYNDLFTYLYVFHDLQRKGTLKDMQELCLELLKFVDNICNRYNIPYWLDFGTLLGSVRHEGFIPWDDDMDVGILKNDFDRFFEVLKKEIEANDLDEFITVVEKKKYDNAITAFIQITYFKSPLVKNMLAGIDIFPYEYLKNDENLPVDELKDSVSKKLKKLQKEYLENEYFKKSPDESLKKFNDALNIVSNEEEYMIESALNLTPRRVKVHKTKDIFPLQKTKFNRYFLSTVNNGKIYLETLYGEDYMKLPKIVSFHTRMQTLMKKDVDDLHELYRGEILRLRKINETWM